jgi:hypothetical protein
VLYSSADCGGQIAGLGTAEELSGGGIEISVADDTTTTLTALSMDVAENVSSCSAPISYAEVTAIPGPGPGIEPPGNDAACDAAKAKLAKAKDKLKKAKESGKKGKIKKAKKKVKKAKKKVAEACG